MYMRRYTEQIPENFDYKSVQRYYKKPKSTFSVWLDFFYELLLPFRRDVVYVVEKEKEKDYVKSRRLK